MYEAKKYLKAFLIVGFIIACLVLGIKYGMQIKYRNDVRDIQNSRTKILDNYNSNQSLAESYLQVYKIVDENSYQMIKNDMYNKFSSDMQEIIFPTVNYSGPYYHSRETTLIKCIGTNNGFNSKNTFLLEYNLKTINYNQDITDLVEIEDGVITRVIKIK